jgi:hypothetical protein
MPSDAITEINNAMEAAVAAQEAGDYRAAVAKAETAWMRICGLPDSQFQDERLEWSREGLASLLAYLSKRANQQAAADSASRGSIIRPTDITYTRG